MCIQVWGHDITVGNGYDIYRANNFCCTIIIRNIDGRAKGLAVRTYIVSNTPAAGGRGAAVNPGTFLEFRCLESNSEPFLVIQEHIYYCILAAFFMVWKLFLVYFN